MTPNDNGKFRPEDFRGRISERELEEVGKVYSDFYTWKSRRSGAIKLFQNKDFESVLTISRELFWNSLTTHSDDLEKLGLDFSIPFARKEVMDYVGRLSALNIKPKIAGENIDALAIKILNGMYKRWSFKSNEKVENFWELLYGIVNGTVCSYIGYNAEKLQRRYLDSYDPETGEYSLSTKSERPWDDVWKEIVPIEDIYLPKIYERNLQKQGKLIWKSQMDEADFHAEYDGKYPNAKYVVAGSRIAEDSLYFRLLGGTGTTSYDKVEVIRYYDWLQDKYILVASGIVLNGLGRDEVKDVAPMPFHHKMAPFTWGIMGPQDEKFSYGLPMPFLVKDPHKILNTGFTMMVERELRAIDPPVLSSDIESPDFIYGQHAVIPVNDVSAYKEFRIGETSPAYSNMLNSLQQNMSAIAQGGDSAAVPSRQPKAAREVMEIAEMKKQAMANAMTMYYDILRQRILLMLKTALQFYPLSKYEAADKRIYRTLVVENVPVSTGGVGTMKMRIVKEKKPDAEIFLEAIRESALNGKKIEIVEIPVEWMQNLESVVITDIKLEPDKSSELELQSFVENVINPMINVYVPAGVASIEKTYLRHLEKMQENAADFSADIPDMFSSPVKSSNAQNGVNQNPAGAFGQNMDSMKMGMIFGGQNNKGLPVNR